MALSNIPSELTDGEKWQCTARWINALYREFLSHVSMKDVGDAILSLEEALYSETNYLPCAVCPIDHKCRNTGEPPQINFKLIERFTGKDTIMGYTLPKEVFTRHHEEYMDNQSPHNDHPKTNGNSHLPNDR